MISPPARCSGPSAIWPGPPGRSSPALGQGGDRNQLLDALRTEFEAAGPPAVLVVEDAHRADEATR
nr:hypothetical protein [uncultured Actinoplanes sp.]